MNSGFYPPRSSGSHTNSSMTNHTNHSNNYGNHSNHTNHKYVRNGGNNRTTDYPSRGAAHLYDSADQYDRWQPTNNPRALQNAEAVVRAGPKGQGREQVQGQAVLREGHLAAALDQIHENDLHGVQHMPPPAQQQKKTPNGRKPEGRKEVAKPRNNLGIHQRPRVRQDLGYEDSELTTKFDPIRDRHMWTMWRTAVNGRIVDAVRRSNTNGSPGIYGGSSSITSRPLSRFIKLHAGSREVAQELSNEGRGQLQASQFVFYGLPRVVVDREPPQ